MLEIRNDQEEHKKRRGEEKDKSAMAETEPTRPIVHSNTLEKNTNRRL